MLPAQRINGIRTTDEINAPFPLGQHLGQHLGLEVLTLSEASRGAAVAASAAAVAVAVVVVVATAAFSASLDAAAAADAVAMKQESQLGQQQSLRPSLFYYKINVFQ